MTERAGLAAPAGDRASPSATMTTTAASTCSSPTGARTRSIGTTATARSPMSPPRPVSPASGGAYPEWHSGATFVDYDRDGRLDLFVATYTDYDIRRVPKPGANPNCNWKGVPTPCGPRGLRPRSQRLYRNRGDGTFEDVSEKSGIAKSRASFGFTAVAADFDDDGWQDIYLACDSTPSLFFHNNRDGTFTEEGLERGLALNPDGMEQAGMGLAVASLHGDGIFDVLKTHFADDTVGLYRGDGQGRLYGYHPAGRAGRRDAIRFVGRGVPGSR